MVYEGGYSGKGKRFALVCARFNELIVNKLLSGARDALLRHGTAEDDIDVIWVPGAFEIPLAALKAAESGRYHAVSLWAPLSAGRRLISIMSARRRQRARRRFPLSADCR